MLIGLLRQANVLFTIALDTKISCKAYVMQNVLGLVDLLDQWSHNELVPTINNNVHVSSISLRAENQPKAAWAAIQNVCLSCEHHRPTLATRLERK